MKQLLSLLAAATLSLGAFAQNGSIAPNFTATDINGIQHDLYSYLDSGYAVILDFSAAWCPPCWDYHEEGVLKTLHEVYGPDSLNQIRVIYLECEDTNTSAQLNGVNAGNTYATASEGDFVTGTPYPIIDNAGSIANDYNVTGFPTILTVCPNRIVTETGQATVQNHVNAFQNASCEPASLPNDAFLLNYVGSQYICSSSDLDLAVQLMNNGLETLTECTFTVYDGATVVETFDWTGSLTTYDIEEVTVATTNVSEDTEFDIVITSTDANTSNNSLSASIIVGEESTNNIRFSLSTDAYPNETQWGILDDMGNLLYSGGPYDTTADQPDQNFTLELGCYFFFITDSYGDGLNGFGGANGSFSLDAMDGEEVSSNLYTYTNPVPFSQIVVPFEVTSISDVQEISVPNALVMFPNPTTGLSNFTITTAVGAESSLEVTNLLGERVLLEDYGILAPGAHRMELNLDGFESGVYLVNFKSGEKLSSVRLIKQ